MPILSTSLYKGMRFFLHLFGLSLLPNIIRLQKVMCVPRMGRTEILSDCFFLFCFFDGFLRGSFPRST